MRSGFVTLALGNQHSIILKQDGSVWSTANDGDDIPSEDHFAKVMSHGAIAVAAGNGFSLVLKKDDSFWVSGRNLKGQLGDGTRIKKEKFSFVQVIDGAKAVAAGLSHSMVLSPF